MSAAVRAKSARARATIAIRMLKTQKRLYRAFDDCLEMSDGDEVVRVLIRHGRQSWLKPDDAYELPFNRAEIKT